MEDKISFVKGEENALNVLLDLKGMFFLVCSTNQTLLEENSTGHPSTVRSVT